MSSRQQRSFLAVQSERRTSAAALPAEFLAEANDRLRIVAGLTVIIALVRIAVAVFADYDALFGTDREQRAKLVFIGGSGLVGAIVTTLTYLRLRPTRMVQIGQIYFVLIIVLLTASEAVGAWSAHPFVRMVPIPIGFVLIFPVIVPQPPRHYLISGFLAVALSAPVFVFVPLLFGDPQTPLGYVPIYLLPLVGATLVGAMSSRLIHKLGKDLGRAHQMGSYQLGTLIGKGGMGEVWRATHGMLARDAAVKLIRRDDGPATREAFKRFKHEARVVASLRSQHTVELYDFGLTEDGTLFYAMELLDGMDLERLVTRHGPQPPERVVSFLVQACHSLGEAHEANMVHRDIKPANLFAARLGRDVDVLKVLDFGLATRPFGDLPGESRVTQEGAIMGTPAYMAPEQVLAESAIDGRADIYTLGLVGWWLLTGRDAFEANSAPQVMFAHVHVEPEAPSKHAPSDIPRELDEVILRCLAKRREDRPQTADALADALRRVPLGAPWTLERAQAWWREHGAAPHHAGPEAIAETLASAVVRKSSIAERLLED